MSIPIGSGNAEKLFPYFEFIGHYGDGLSVLDQVVEKGPLPILTQIPSVFHPSGPSFFCQHPDEIFCFVDTVLTKYFVDDHLITSEKYGIPAISTNPDDSPSPPVRSRNECEETLGELNQEVATITGF